MFTFDSWGLTHPGKVRQVNEDSYLVEPAAGLWVVADGMGGHEAGEVASGAIVAHLATIGRPGSQHDQRARVLDRLRHANREMQRYAVARGDITMGSTMVALMLFEDRYAGIWAGDSRLYLFREGRLTQLSRDHSQAQEMIDAGALTVDEARHWAHRNVITNAIGITEEVSVETVTGIAEHGDRYLLCSDGLTTHVNDPEIEAILARTRPRQACDELLALTLERGATDNVTVVVVQCWRNDATMPIEMMR